MLFDGAGHSYDQIFHATGVKSWHYTAQLSTLSVAYPFCGSALTDTSDNLSELCTVKLIGIHYHPAKILIPVLYHQSNTFLHRHIFPHDQGSNLQPPDERAGTLTTQPLQLASSNKLAGKYSHISDLNKSILSTGFEIKTPT